MVSYYGSSLAAGSSGNPGDGPGSASPFSAHFAQAPSDRLLTYIECHHHVVSWHTTLNNHASTRPKEHGGPIVSSVTGCKTFTASGPANASWECVVDLPNSFSKDDGIRLRVSCKAPEKQKASEDACRLAFAYLLLENPGQVLLRPRHWTVSKEDLLRNMPASVPPHQALPVHVDAKRARMDAESAAERFSDPPAVWEDRVVQLLREILNHHEGSFDPSRISHKATVSYTHLTLPTKRIV